MLELGNFDSFYEQGLKFTADDVIAMTIQTRSWFPQIPLSVTIPHTLPLSEQGEYCFGYANSNSTRPVNVNRLYDAFCYLFVDISM